MRVEEEEERKDFRIQRRRHDEGHDINEQQNRIESTEELTKNTEMTTNRMRQKSEKYRDRRKRLAE